MLLEVCNVWKSYPTGEGVLRVLAGVSLTLDRGESLALTGESGSGKSTLLSLVAGLDRVEAGDIRIDGASIRNMDDAGLARLRRTATGLIFQQFNLIPSLSVRDNLAFQARIAGRLSDGSVDRLAERLGLQPVLERYPDQLSGGQQQRVAIGRTLAAQPPLILADEPTGNLDEATASAVLDLMIETISESGSALLMVTHSSRLASRLGRRLHLSSGRVS